MSLIDNTKMALKLPRWAFYLGKERLLVDAKKKEFKDIISVRVTYQDVYPYFMKLLEIEELNQYWYEVIRMCATRHIHLLLGENPMRIVWDSQGEKEKWKMNNFPWDPRWKGQSAQHGVATFRSYFEKIRGKIK